MAHHDLLIIGTGSGNTIVNHRFSGWDVGIVEEGTFGGTCINVGCIPTKMFVHAADVARSAETSARFGVDAHVDKVRWTDIRDRIFARIDPIAVDGERYRRNSPNVAVYGEHVRFTGPKRLETAGGDTVTADQIVVAAGSRAIVPEIPGLEGAFVHTSDTIMRIDDLPATMTILGGGVIAAEMAHVFSALGVSVTLVARSGRLLMHEDREISERFTKVVADRWDLRLSTKVTHVEPAGDGGRLHLAWSLDGTTAGTVDAGIVLVATGRIPNSDRLDVTAAGITTHPDGRVWVDAHQQTVVPGIWALGDVSSKHQLKHVANHEARVVKHNLLNPGAPIAADHRFVPRAIFSSPQISSVGATEEDLLASGTPYVMGIEEYGDIAYGWAMEDTTGFAKVLADPASGRLLGAHIMGPQAPTVIQPLIQAMSFGLSGHDMVRGQYWIHPAMPEVVENALLQLG